jgi:oligopeptide transport system substrate-binding protein
MRRRTGAGAGASVLALVVTACSGGVERGSGSGTSPERPGGEVLVYGCNPQGPLVAGNTAEGCGGNVLSTMTSQLIHYDSETAEPENDIAGSIRTEDNQHFTVALKSGYTFGDGTEVQAHNFVDAWNYVSYAPNGQQNSYFFAPIEGYADLQCPDPDCTNDPKAAQMSGLKVVDDHTFTITTTEKVANLPLRLGYAGFAPQPDSFFDDPEAFGKNPVGAGPYMLDHWTQNEEIVVVRNPHYSGEWPGKLDRIAFKIFQDLDAA